MIAEQLKQTTFHANHQREQAFLRTVTQYGGQPRTVLDLGCGDGSSTVGLADYWPSASVTGIDLATANIAIAQTRQRDQRIDFYACDYATTPLPMHDLIVADTVLHLIDLPPEVLFHKLASELAIGGRLIFSAPEQGGFNRGLTIARRMLRLVRGRLCDRLIVRLAKLVHGARYSDDFLRERLAYMYIIPRFFLSASLEHLLATCGLTVVARVNYPHTSIGQMKHAVWVCERR